MLISTISYNAKPLTTVFSQLFTFFLLSGHLLNATVCTIMSQHKPGYVISYHGILCHDMSYVTTIVASLVEGEGSRNHEMADFN